MPVELERDEHELQRVDGEEQLELLVVDELVDDHAVLGDPRVNENPALLSFGLMFYRWHNRQADRLAARHPSWTDEELFQVIRID